MGDNSCSGSTPFKSLVDHGGQDRSLHQDRFSTTFASQHVFRSSGSMSSPQAQHGFGAFLTTNAPSSHAQPISSPSIAPHLVNHYDGRLSMNNPASTSNTVSSVDESVARRQYHIPNAPPEATGWAQDFARFSQNTPASSSSALIRSTTQNSSLRSADFATNMRAFPSRPSFFRPVGGPGALAEYGPTSHGADAVQADFDLEMDRWMAAHGHSRLEDVDAIMEELARQMEQEEITATQNDDRTLGISLRGEELMPATVDGEKSVEQEDHSIRASSGISQPNQPPDVSRLGLDDMADATSADLASRGQSEISEAARQILESVQHEQGDKWKNSRFLLLMRDFRDGNKDIINNEILETHADDGHLLEKVKVTEA
ncbi:hypothetical protein GCG54_00014899 [Colletotrichum gloeosporioides]|uniref:Peroxin 20 n=1 Tax=Colletotrichum gloeosporioides TaxID=474922 RepID=A0A8H4CDA4_COLGL|nr:uncharacterized protein GCG54_00014899 [Colletotrichum gloeosporioides]KAF3801683.1 hypothetical protein GCG54_00014899 [Colletotrichum gloeosporioides]